MRTHIVGKTGGRVIKVKPNYTSQICCNCDAYVPKELSDRIHDCKACNVGIICRDINAAVNIKRVGLGVFVRFVQSKSKRRDGWL